MIVVRRISLGEAELFKEIRLASLRESPYAFTATYEAALNRSYESWSEQADHSAQGSDRATFLAFAGHSPIGVAALYRDIESIEMGELLQVWVCPEYRGKGVAREILDAIFRWAAENGFRTIVARVATNNERAYRFYRKYGFKLLDGVALHGRDDPVLAKEISLEN